MNLKSSLVYYQDANIELHGYFDDFDGKCHFELGGGESDKPQISKVITEKLAKDFSALIHPLGQEL